MKIAKRPLPLSMLIITGLLCVLLALQFFSFTLKSDQILLLIICTSCTVLFTFTLTFEKNCRLHNPLVFITLITVIGVTLRGYYMVYFPQNVDVNFFFLQGNDIDYFLVPSLIVFLGFVCFLIGYKTTRRPFIFKRLQVFRGDYIWSRKRLLWLVLGFSIISFAGIILFINQLGITSLLENISSKRSYKVEGSTFNSSLSYYRLMASFIEPAFYIYFLDFLLRRKKLLSLHGLVLVTLGVSNLFFPIFTSSRTDFVYFGFNILVILAITRKLSIQILGLTFLFGISLFSLVTTLRSSSKIQIDEITLLDPIIFNRNLLDLSVTATIINEVPTKMPFQNGASFLTLLTAPIPRVLWPQKPPVSMGKDIARELYNYGDHTQTGIPPGIIGELYVNFRLIGVFIGLFILGLLIKKVYLYFDFETNRGFSKNKIILYTAVVTNMTVLLFGGSFNQAALGFLQAYIPVYLGLKYISIKQLPLMVRK